MKFKVKNPNRQNAGMGRRNFLQLLGGLGTGLAAGSTLLAGPAAAKKQMAAPSALKSSANLNPTIVWSDALPVSTVRGTVIGGVYDQGMACIYSSEDPSNGGALLIYDIQGKGALGTYNALGFYRPFGDLHASNGVFVAPYAGAGLYGLYTAATGCSSICPGNNEVDGLPPIVSNLADLGGGRFAFLTGNGVLNFYTFTPDPASSAPNYSADPSISLPVISSSSAAIDFRGSE